MTKTFRLGITRDFLRPDGTLGFGDIGLDTLQSQTHIDSQFLAADYDQIPRSVADEYDALLVLKPSVTSETLDGCRRLLLVARFGVGYDNVDTQACTRNHVLLTITPDGVRRPVAVSALALLLALSHKLLIKDHLTRAGRWAEKLDHMGVGLTAKTLGVIGLGNIGREVFRLAAPLDMRHVGYDPYVKPEQLSADGIQWLELDELLSVSDFVIVCCALTTETQRLLDARRLGLLRPTAYLINVARGPIIDQNALTAVLEQNRIAGAALDVFEHEPIATDDPLLKLDNVILAPHAICWSDELFRNNGRSAIQSVIDVAAGRVPQFVVNRDVVQQVDFQKKLSLHGNL
jgi:phosphoglycerate dehydrogenase-like enzyme